MKIGMRQLYNKELNLSWDDELPIPVKCNWIEILKKVKMAENVTFSRCVKPPDTIGKPVLL